MNDLTITGHIVMTVKEVAEALGISERVVQLAVKRLYPHAVQNGKTTYLNEEKVTRIKQDLASHHNLEGTFGAATTDLEMAEKTVEVITWAMARIEAQKAEIAVLKPKANVADILSLVSDGKTISEVGKITGLGPHKLGDLLEAQGILFRTPTGDRVPYQPQIEAGRFIVKERVFSGSGGQLHRRSQTYVTGKGEVWIAEKFCRKELA